MKVTRVIVVMEAQWNIMEHKEAYNVLRKSYGWCKYKSTSLDMSRLDKTEKPRLQSIHPTYFWTSLAWINMRRAASMRQALFEALSARLGNEMKLS